MTEQLDEFRRVLESEARDVDGRLLRAGTTVLCHPDAPDEIRDDNPENRRQFERLSFAWTDETRLNLVFPKLADCTATFRTELESATVARRRFATAIDENLRSSVGELFPDVRLPFWFKLLPVNPLIRRVDDFSLTSQLIGDLKHDSGIDVNAEWPSEWTDRLAQINKVSVYTVSCLGARLHVLVAFLGNIRFDSRSGPSIEIPSQSAVETAYRHYRESVTSSKLTAPNVTFATVASPKEWPEDVVQRVGDTWSILSSPIGDEKWTAHSITGVSGSRSVTGFLTRLRPETREQRTERVRIEIDRLLESGLDRADVGRIKKALSYERTDIEDAFFALRKTGDFRLFWHKTDGRQILAIDRRIDLPAPKVRRRQIRRRLWLVQIATMIVVQLIWIALKIAVMTLVGGEPFHWFDLLAGYAGLVSGKYLGTIWQPRE